MKTEIVIQNDEQYKEWQEVIKNVMKPKSWEECCDEVAKKYGFEKYTHAEAFLETHSIDDGKHPIIHTVGHFLKEAAQLYREEGIREAIKLAREIVSESGYACERLEQEILDKLNPQ